MELQLTSCPEPACGAVAEVVDTVILASTGGPVETIRTRCLHRHSFVVPASRLASREPDPVRPR